MCSFVLYTTLPVHIWFFLTIPTTIRNEVKVIIRISYETLPRFPLPFFFLLFLPLLGFAPAVNPLFLCPLTLCILWLYVCLGSGGGIQLHSSDRHCSASYEGRWMGQPTPNQHTCLTMSVWRNLLFLHHISFEWFSKAEATCYSICLSFSKLVSIYLSTFFFFSFFFFSSQAILNNAYVNWFVFPLCILS